MSKDLVSIITPTYNKLEFLKQMMDSIELFTDNWPFELIIIDNASNDGTKEFIITSKYKMNGQYLRNEENKSFSISNNQGVKIAKGSFLLFLNNDTIVTKGWLSKMMNVFSEEKAVGIIGAKLIFPGTGLIQHAGIFELNSGMPDHLYFKKPADYLLANQRKAVFGVTGACLLISKSLFEEIGGFDENYINGFEDIDLCNKVRQKGMNIYYEPKAVVYHYESRTEGRYLHDSRNFSLYASRWILKGK